MSSHEIRFHADLIEQGELRKRGQANRGLRVIRKRQVLLLSMTLIVTERWWRKHDAMQRSNRSRGEAIPDGPRGLELHCEFRAHINVLAPLTWEEKRECARLSGVRIIVSNAFQVEGRSRRFGEFLKQLLRVRGQAGEIRCEYSGAMRRRGIKARPTRASNGTQRRLWRASH